MQNRLFNTGGTIAAPTLTYNSAVAGTFGDTGFLAPQDAAGTIFRERQIQFAIRFQF